MSYGYVYVAQVAMGADQAQTLKALREAESYPGPSIVICYCPCLEQHIKAGMSCTQEEMKKAVECGYWHLYRYDPRRTAEGKNPFQLDSAEPDTSKLMDFLMGENRFASLKNNFPAKADALYAKEVADVKAGMPSTAAWRMRRCNSCLLSCPHPLFHVEPRSNGGRTIPFARMAKAMPARFFRRYPRSCVSRPQAKKPP